MRIGLALSGGGVRGAVHIGVLKALEENKIIPDVLSGTSAGSIVAALYSVGYTANEIEDIIKKNVKNIRMEFDIRYILDHLKAMLWSRNKKIDGFVKGDIIKKVINNYCIKKGCPNIKDTIKPLAIPAVDINTSKVVMFISNKKGFKQNSEIELDDDVDLAMAVRASISYPVVFKPCMVKGRRLVDGGIRDNVPVNILRLMGADKIIAVNLGYAGKVKDEVDNVFEIAVQSIDIMAHEITKRVIGNASYVLRPEVYDVKLFEINRIQECIDRGYKAAVDAMPEIKKALYY